MATITIEGIAYAYDQALTGSDARSDVLIGTDNAVRYYINGLGQNDTLTGAARNDILVGGHGSDVLTGGAGNDVLIGDHVDAQGKIVGDATVVAPSFEAIIPPSDNAGRKAWENYEHRLEDFLEHVNVAATYKLNGVTLTGQALLKAWMDFKDHLTVNDVHVVRGHEIADIDDDDTEIHDIHDHTESAAFLNFGRIEPVGGRPSQPSIDTAVFAGPADDYTVLVSRGSVTVTDNVGSDGTDKLIGIERLQFSDRTLELTWFSKTAELSSSEITHLTDLYIASFDRAPDAMGLAYWGSQLKDGMSLQQIAKSFFTQPEAAAAYPHGQSIRDFITAVYNHVLERAPDAPGLAYWGGELGAGHVAKDSFLLAVINGAHGGADDRILANKGLVGAHFALTQGLNDVAEAKAVMADVDDSARSVANAYLRTDEFADVHSDLSVKIVGIAG